MECGQEGNAHKLGKAAAEFCNAVCGVQENLCGDSSHGKNDAGIKQCYLP